MLPTTNSTLKWVLWIPDTAEHPRHSCIFRKHFKLVSTCPQVHDTQKLLERESQLLQQELSTLTSELTGWSVKTQVRHGYTRSQLPITTALHCKHCTANTLKAQAWNSL